MKLSRKQLLAASAAAFIPAACSSPPVAADGSSATFTFDPARFERILAIRARHKQCVASAKVANGLVFYAMVATLYAYEFDLHEGAGTVHEVGVFYHPEGVVLGLGDGVWNDIIVPALPYLLRHEFSGFRSKPAQPGKGNPYLHRDKRIALEDDPSIEALASRGCHFFVCNNALRSLAGTLAIALHRPQESIYARMRDDLVPNSMVVPAGVMAINACQEAHFTYLQAAL